MVGRQAQQSVLVTRPEPGGHRLATALRARGLEAVIYPTTRIRTFEDLSALDNALDHLETYDWTIFASTTPLRLVLERLSQRGLSASALAASRLLAGPATGAHLEALGLTPVIIRPQFSAAAAAAYLRTYEMQGKRVLLPGAAGGRRELPDALRAQGALVDEFPLYTSEPELAHGPAILAHLRTATLAMITLASPSAVHGLIAALEAAGEPFPTQVLAGIPVVCIGRTTAEAAIQHGLHVARIAEETSASALADAVCAYLDCEEVAR